MGTAVARRSSYGPVPAGRASTFRWHREHATAAPSVVCKFWLQGRCSRNPCRFLHPEVGGVLNLAQKIAQKEQKKCMQNVAQKIAHKEQKKCMQKKTTDVVPVRPSNSSDINKINAEKTVDHQQEKIKIVEEQKQLQQSNVANLASDQDTIKEKKEICDCCGDGLTLLAHLDGHKKPVTGVTLPKGCDRLISSSKDGTICVWNCHTAECTKTIDMGSPIECLISEGLLVFAGYTNKVWVVNMADNTQVTLIIPGEQSQVQVLCTEDRSERLILCVGLSDGSISVWTLNHATNLFEEFASLKGHTGAVTSLHISGDMLFSGSLDNTIRCWDLKTQQCAHVLDKHSDVVMSLVCWGRFLLSSSLDHTLKAWDGAAGMQELYTHKEEHGMLALCGFQDDAGSDILLGACNDNTTRLYELPTFKERGRVFSQEEVRRIEVGPDGLIFTGDATGRVSVWKYSRKTTTEVESTS